MHPEKSVPVTGFSRELRLADDVERYRFSFALHGEVALPVHVVYSPSDQLAEVKAADLKVYRVDGVGSACEARNRWVSWWKSRRPPTTFAPPRRTGRLPIARTSAS